MFFSRNTKETRMGIPHGFPKKERFVRAVVSHLIRLSHSNRWLSANKFTRKTDLSFNLFLMIYISLLFNDQ